MSLILCKSKSSEYKIVADSEKTHQFAARELQKYLHLASDVSLPIANHTSGPAIILKQTGTDQDRDQYTIMVDNKNIHITGSNRRSVLYGVYAFLETIVGIRFFAPDFECVPKHDKMEVPCTFRFDQTTDFRIRTLRAEWTMNVTLVDWAAKNRYNSFSLDMWRLDGSTEWVDANAIFKAAEERGLMIEGSGHAMCYFLKSNTYYDAHPEWFCQVDGKRLRGMYTGDNFCYSNPDAVETCAKNVIAFLRMYPVIKRLSIWMGDGGTACECETCRQHLFMETYGRAVKYIAKRAREELGDVVVFQEAYNQEASNILNPRFVRTLEQKIQTLRIPPEHYDLPTLFAFWGQDLTIPLAENNESGHRLFHTYLKEYCDHNPSGAYIFSMHTDTFMLSNLCPVFGQPMVEDFKEFKRLGIDQMFLLWITWNTESDQNMEWIGYQNGAMWSRLAENRNFDIQAYRREYYQWAFGPAQSANAEELWNRLNAIVNKLQALVFPFAPLRSTDAWGCGFNRKYERLRWNLNLAFGQAGKDRIMLFSEAQIELERLNQSIKELSDTNLPECTKFKKYINHCLIRTKGLTCLFKAQEAMQAEKWVQAKTFLIQALDCGMTDEREDTQEWLKFVESKL